MKRRLALEWTIQNFLTSTPELSKGVERVRTYFWTFTTQEEESAKQMGAMWNRLLGKLRTRWGKVDFVRVLEPHRSGTRFHLHVLFRARFPVDLMRELARSCGFGRIHVKRAVGLALKNYLVKYLTKAGRSAALEGVKMFSCSQKPDTFQRVCLHHITYTEDGKTFSERFGHLWLGRHRREAGRIAALAAMVERDSCRREARELVECMAAEAEAGGDELVAWFYRDVLEEEALVWEGAV